MNDVIRTHALKTVHDFETLDEFEEAMIAFGETFAADHLTHRKGPALLLPLPRGSPMGVGATRRGLVAPAEGKRARSGRAAALKSRATREAHRAVQAAPLVLAC